MRRRSALILLAAAVFCAALAPLLREYAFPRLAAKALGGEDAYRVTVLEARNATLFGAPEPPGTATATIVQTIRPDARASKDGTVVWDTNVTLLDSTGRIVTTMPERYAFDADTQAPRNCCGESVDGKPAAHTGIQYKWPFFTEKRDYNSYDAQTRSAAPISYKGVRKVRGLETYLFEQETPWTRAPMPSRLPGELTPEGVEAAGMERWFTTVRRFWVEPVTGAPVDVEEIRQEELRVPAEAGSGMAPGVVKVFDGSVRMKPEWSERLVEDAKEQSARLRLLHDQGPLGLLVAGVLLFLGALLLERLGRRPARAEVASSAGGPPGLRFLRRRRTDPHPEAAAGEDGEDEDTGGGAGDGDGSGDGRGEGSGDGNRDGSGDGKDASDGKDTDGGKGDVPPDTGSAAAPAPAGSTALQGAGDAPAGGAEDGTAAVKEAAAAVAASGAADGRASTGETAGPGAGKPAGAGKDATPESGGGAAVDPAAETAVLPPAVDARGVTPGPVPAGGGGDTRAGAAGPDGAAAKD